MWPWVVGRLVGDSRKVVGGSEGGRDVVGRWSGGGPEVVGGGREVVGGGRKVVGGGRKWFGNSSAVFVWRLQPGSNGAVPFELAVA